MNKTDPCSEAFERWWYNEGSGIIPTKDEETETFAHRITAIAWSNGAYAAIAEKESESKPAPIHERHHQETA